MAIASGIPIAVSKIVSEKNAVGNTEESFKVMKASLIVMLILHKIPPIYLIIINYYCKVGGIITILFI